MNLKKIRRVFTSKFVGTGPSSYKKRIYRAAVSQRLRKTALGRYTALCGHLKNYRGESLTIRSLCQQNRHRARSFNIQFCFITDVSEYNEKAETKYRFENSIRKLIPLLVSVLVSVM